MTLTIGWWAIPAIISITTWIWACWPQRTSGYGADIVGAMQLMAAMIVSLLAWLVWSLAA